MKRSKTYSEIVRDWFTGPDGETWDPARMLWIAGVVAFLCFTGHEVYKSDKFDMVNFAMAYGALLAAGAAGVKIKESTEPAAKIDTPPPPPPADGADDDVPIATPAPTVKPKVVKTPKP